jgi:predicted TIM-barrel fold metal-dependent hydrolase
MAMLDCARHVGGLRISEKDKAAILGQNAEALLPLRA